MNDLFSDLENSISDFSRLKSHIGPHWFDLFTPEMCINYDKLIGHLMTSSEIYKVLPVVNNTFKIYRDCPPFNVNVVILGQDPYHSNNNAMGYAFGCSTTMSPSLYNLLQAISQNYNKTSIKKTSILEYLVKQGVFLLNTRLAVYENKPLSYNYDWESITAPAISLINSFDRPIVWMLWGAHAQHYAKYIKNPKHLILTAEHPASAARDNRTWSCDHFRRANEFLPKPIIWY